MNYLILFVQVTFATVVYALLYLWYVAPRLAGLPLLAALQPLLGSKHSASPVSRSSPTARSIRRSIAATLSRPGWATWSPGCWRWPRSSSSGADQAPPYPSCGH